MKKIFLFSLFFFSLICFPLSIHAQSDSGSVNVGGNVIGTPPSTSPAIPSSFAPFSISNVVVNGSEINSVNISWETSEEAICKLLWGKSLDYEGGSILESDENTQHSTIIPNLLTNITYHLLVSCQNNVGQKIETKDQTFNVPISEANQFPFGVDSFESISSDKQIELKWHNPSASSFRNVRLIRSTEKYPQNPSEAELIYSGSGSSFVDQGLINDVTYYYSIFAYDEYGNYSAGSFVFGIPKSEKISPITNKIEPTQEANPQIPQAITQGTALELNDFIFSQDGKSLLFDGQTVTVNSGEPFTISINKEKISLEANNIVMTLFQPNPTSLVFYYDSAQKGFIASESSIDQAGEYNFVIQVINKNGEVFAFAMGNIKAKPSILNSAPISSPSWIKRASLLIKDVFQQASKRFGNFINKTENYSAFFPYVIAFFSVLILFFILEIRRPKK